MYIYTEVYKKKLLLLDFILVTYKKKICNFNNVKK